MAGLCRTNEQTISLHWMCTTSKQETRRISGFSEVSSRAGGGGGGGGVGGGNGQDLEWNSYHAQDRDTEGDLMVPYVVKLLHGQASTDRMSRQCTRHSTPQI